MDDAALFFRRALRVQCHEPFKDFGIRRSVWPAVGGGHGGVEFVVQTFERGNQSPVVDKFFLFRERFPGADFIEDVVKAGERDAVLGLHLFAVRVQRFRQFADARFLFFPAQRKRKRIKAIRLYINRVVAVSNPSPRRN